jgi:nitroreductase
MRTPEGREAVGLPDDERFVSLIHLGRPVQDKAPPERAPVGDVVTYLD